MAYNKLPFIHRNNVLKLPYGERFKNSNTSNASCVCNVFARTSTLSTSQPITTTLASVPLTLIGCWKLSDPIAGPDL